MKTYLFVMALIAAMTGLYNRSAAIETRGSSTAPELLKITRQVSPFFPVRLLRQGVTHGEAVLALSLDPSGKLSDCLVARYTHPEFADAAMKAIKQWKFQLAQPTSVVMEVEFIYRLDGVLAVERFGGEVALNPTVPRGGYLYQPCAPAELDRQPKPTHVVSPGYPIELEQQGIEGTVAISFYIDEEGRPRLPAPLTQENRELSGLATAAVEQWHFEPPTRAGKPVLVRATQRFSFVAKK